MAAAAPGGKLSGGNPTVDAAQFEALFLPGLPLPQGQWKMGRAFVRGYLDTMVRTRKVEPQVELKKRAPGEFDVIVSW